MAIGDFWVINLNDVFEFKGFEYGIDFLFSLHLIRDEELLKFVDERWQLRNKVYHSLFKKMFFFAQLVAVCCVYFEECDENGVVPSPAARQMRMIDRFFEGKKSFFEWSFDRIFAQSDGKHYMGEDEIIHKGHDAKELLSEQLWDLIVQILATTVVQRELATKGEEIDGNEYNRRIVEQYYYYMKDKYDDHTHYLHRLLKKCSSRTRGKVGTDSIVQLTFNKVEFDIYMNAYKFLLDRQFANNGAGKKFCNHFVDMTNVAMVEIINDCNVIVQTSDMAWQSILLNTDYNSWRVNTEFYKRYKR